MPTPSTPITTDTAPVPANVAFGDLPSGCAFIYNGVLYTKLSTVCKKENDTTEVAFGFFGNDPVAPKVISNIDFGI